MDWLDRENRKKDAPGTWLFGWFVLAVVVVFFMKEPVAAGILLVLLGWYVRREWERSEHNADNQGDLTF